FVTLPNGILQVLDVTVDDRGLYRCVASNSADMLYSQDASLTVTSDCLEYRGKEFLFSQKIQTPDSKQTD
ncbi:immunoglobulin superfamily DCC subclass member 4 isoform X1, partial [Tachysurus ichikawai]